MSVEDITDSDLSNYVKIKRGVEQNHNKRNWKSLISKNLKTNLKIISAEERSLDFMVQLEEVIKNRGLEFLRDTDSESKKLIEHLITRVRHMNYNGPYE
jgi:hypothetical protein